MFQLAHASSLSIHLLETIILGEFLHKLALEFFFHTSFFFSTLLLESELVLTGGLEFLTNLDSLLSLGSLLDLSCLFALLHIKVVSELLLEHLLSHSLLLFGC